MRTGVGHGHMTPYSAQIHGVATHLQTPYGLLPLIRSDFLGDAFLWTEVRSQNQHISLHSSSGPLPFCLWRRSFYTTPTCTSFNPNRRGTIPTKASKLFAHLCEHWLLSGCLLESWLTSLLGWLFVEHEVHSTHTVLDTVQMQKIQSFFTKNKSQSKK